MHGTTDPLFEKEYIDIVSQHNKNGMTPYLLFQDKEDDSLHFMNIIYDGGSLRQEIGDGDKKLIHNIPRTIISRANLYAGCNAHLQNICNFIKSDIKVSIKF